MNELTARKHRLIAQADLNRKLIVEECTQLSEQWNATRARVGQNRWWLVGGAIAGGWLITRRAHGLLKWLPTAFGILRILRR